MDNIILIAILAVMIGLAVWYVVKAKKSGKKCIGCPDSGGCGCSCEGCGGCADTQ